MTKKLKTHQYWALLITCGLFILLGIGLHSIVSAFAAGTCLGYLLAKGE